MFLKSLQRLLPLALSAALVLSLSACTIHVEKKDKDTASYASSDNDYGISSDDSSVSSKEDVSSAATDTQEFGNDQVGWLTLDSDFYQWYTPGNTETCVHVVQLHHFRRTLHKRFLAFQGLLLVGLHAADVALF